MHNLFPDLRLMTPSPPSLSTKYKANPPLPTERLAKAWEREHTRFLADYNARLLNGLTLCSIAGILLFRFVVRVQLGESVAWGAFVFFQVCWAAGSVWWPCPRCRG